MRQKEKIMKAVKCLKYGGSKNLVLVDVEKPVPKNNEVLIAIKATAVTASDVLIRRLDEPLIPKFILQVVFGFGKPRNPILGMVSSGMVVAKGKKVTSFQIGQEVFACGSISTINHRFESYAEYN